MQQGAGVDTYLKELARTRADGGGIVEIMSKA